MKHFPAKRAALLLMTAALALGMGSPLAWSVDTSASPIAVKPVPSTAQPPVPVKQPPPSVADGDDDHDGIPNKDDLCPDSEPGEKVNQFGCNPDGDG